eukprot:COSAG02_NODE_2938_length_7699_cov_20.606316_3_plen_57_part_00
MKVTLVAPNSVENNSSDSKLYAHCFPIAEDSISRLILDNYVYMFICARDHKLLWHR